MLPPPLRSLPPQLRSTITCGLSSVSPPLVPAALPLTGAPLPTTEIEFSLPPSSNRSRTSCWCRKPMSGPKLLWVSLFYMCFLPLHFIACKVIVLLPPILAGNGSMMLFCPMTLLEQDPTLDCLQRRLLPLHNAVLDLVELVGSQEVGRYGIYS